jgi:hypothetical protein
MPEYTTIYWHVLALSGSDTVKSLKYVSILWSIQHMPEYTIVYSVLAVIWLGNWKVCCSNPRPKIILRASEQQVSLVPVATMEPLGVRTDQPEQPRSFGGCRPGPNVIKLFTTVIYEYS